MKRSGIAHPDTTYGPGKEQIKKALPILLLIIGGILVISILAFAPVLGKSDDEPYVVNLPEGIIEVDGKKYQPKKNIETYLFMGIDKVEKVEKATEYGTQGRSDVVILLVRDLSTGTYKTLNLNRNLLVEQDSLDLDGSYIGTSEAVLALAHENGDGLEISCENVVKAVSKFLGDIRIDGYAAVNMGAIGTINNLVGGVTVTIEDDFSKIDSTLVKGETITLTDEQAVEFVHSRWNVGEESNEERMGRHSMFLADLKLKLRHLCTEDKKYPLTIYQALEEYMVTNITDQKFSKIALLMLEDKDEGELVIDGTLKLNELSFMEMEPDERSLTDVKLKLFYREYN